MLDFEEFLFIFCRALNESGISLSEMRTGLFSLRMASEEEDDGYGDLYCADDDDEDRYVLCIRAAKTAVIDGIQLPLPLALKAAATTIQREAKLVIIDVIEAEGGANIEFKSLWEYGIKTGGPDADK